MNHLSTLYSIFTVAILIIVSGFFSGSETGMMSLNRYRNKHRAKEGNKGAVRVDNLLKRPDRLLGVILIGNTFANVVASAIATMIAQHYFGEFGVLMMSLVLTLFILIFAETVPKTFAAVHPEKVAYPASTVLALLLKALYPLVWSVNLIANGILKIFRVNLNRSGWQALSAEELATVVNEASSKLKPGFQQMLLRILDLGKVTVEDIMVPKKEIFGIRIDQEWHKVVEDLIHCTYTHVPIYNESIEDVKGFINVREVLSLQLQGKLTYENLLNVAREVLYVPEGTEINKQLIHFKEKKYYFGLVVDEYGEIQGLVYLKDLLTEIVGEFTSNVAAPAEEEYQKLEGGSYLVDGAMLIRDFTRVSGWHLPLDGPKTISGLIIEELESLPAAKVSIKIEGYYLEVISMSHKVIKQVKIWPVV